MNLFVKSSEAMEALGAQLASAAVPAIVYLDGELGTGKTTLVRGLLRAMGHTGKVRSPTYTLVEPYQLDAGTVYHLDLYRLGHAEELEFLGLRDLLADPALLLVEWPERGAGILPAADLAIHIKYAATDDGRDVSLEPATEAGRQLVSRVESL